jgi:hypothetical protein
MAGTTGLEPAASAVTGQRSNQLNYVPTRQINEMRNNQRLCGFARLAYCASNCFGCLKERDSCPNRPQTATKFRHFRALLRFPKQPAQLLAIQSSANPDKTISKTFANLCRRNILTASRRTRKTTFIFPGRTERDSQIRQQLLVRPGSDLCLSRRPVLIVRSRGIVSIS